MSLNISWGNNGIIIQKNQVAIIAIATAILLTTLTSGLLISNQNVPSNGTISTVNVGVYTDSQCTTNCTSINWSTLTPSSSTTKTIYIKNSGTTPLSLSLTTSNWNPSNANSYITLSWDKESSILAAGSSTAATLTLNVSQSITGITTFSFNIIITGTET